MSQDSWPFLDSCRGSEAGIDLNAILGREYLSKYKMFKQAT